MFCVTCVQEFLSEMKLLVRFQLTHYNYEYMEIEKDSILKEKKEAMDAKDAVEGKVRELEERLWRQRDEFEEA